MEEDHYDTPWEFLARPTSMRLSAAEVRLPSSQIREGQSLHGFQLCPYFQIFVLRNLFAFHMAVVISIIDIYFILFYSYFYLNFFVSRAILGTLLKAPNIHKERSIRPYILGLCGGIASGKSNIARILSEQPGFEVNSFHYLLSKLFILNLQVIDCDKLAHSCYERSCELTKKIDERFEGVVKDGVVDRKALGKIVFGNQLFHCKENIKARLSELNNLIWPIIMEKVKDIIANSENDVIVIEAAAIVEAKWQGFMNELWTVFVPHDEAIQRVMSRDGLSKDEVSA
uniref:Dephospho-CoA kinase n=1 Tax=Heterorhabditis bacteriophora TaxID=37862 RepID=A0A1I7XE93_HETBA